MSDGIDEPVRDDAGTYFKSSDALKAAHRDLLKRRRAAGESLEFLAQADEFIRQGRTIGKILDAEDDRWAIQGMLDYWSTLLYSAGREPSDATLDDFDPDLAPTLDDDLCPYLGLDRFDEANNDVFFGRERLVKKMVQRLRNGRLLAVVGPSGSGKSSVVLAGLVPVIKKGTLPGSQDWRYYRPMVPGSKPLFSLARTLRPLDVDGAEWDEQQADRFRQDPEHLLQLASESDTPIVLIVDQFEELFTLCLDVDERKAFVDNLLALIQAPKDRHTVILTLRVDFEPNVASLRAFHRAFQDAEVHVTPLNASELRKAIERPAERIGLKYEEGVVDALIHDILGEPAALPLLQFSLLKLWEHRDHNRITRAAYDHLGGGRRALERSADEFYEDLKTYENQAAAKHILLRMVRPGEGMEFTSKRIRRLDLYREGPAQDRINRVLQAMIDARLVRLTEGETGEDDQVEVAHEALVRNWPRLVDWLDMERESMRRRLRLTTAAEEWETQDRDPSDLLRGRLLEEAESYPDLNELEREFVAESRAAVKKEERDKEAVRQRELEQARALATSEQRRAEQQARDARRLRWLTYALAGMFVVAVVAATLAAVAWQEAENQADSAEAAQARAEAAEKEATSRLLAIVQWREYFQEGKLDMALHTLQQAEELDPDLQSERGPKLAWAYHEVCVKGRSGGQSETVQPACQRAEQLASEIPFEETVGGIVQARHGDLWMFQGTPGQVVSVRMEQEDSELDTYLTLYSPDGTLLGENDDFGDGTDSRIDWVVLSSPVTYTIVAFGAEDTFGAYVLTLTHEQMPASEAVQMLIGQSIKYARRGLIDQALAALNLAVELDPDLQSERGPKLAWAYHEVCVKGGSGGQTKAVRPACQRARELATEIPFEETVGGVVKARQGDLWTFQGTAGQAVTLRMEQDNSELDTYLTLYSPDGTLLGENDDPGGSYDSLIAQVVLWDTGPHTIVVRGLGNSSGAYTLKLTFEQVSPSKAAQKLVQQGAEYASQDLIDQALTALYLAENLDPLLDPTQASDLVVAYNMVCWMGSLGGRAEAVLPFCQRAVDLEPGHGGIRDSRGLARALTGDLEGAVEDFEFYVEWVQDRRPIDMIEKRRTWIEALEVGRNPFDKETLEALRHE